MIKRGCRGKVVLEGDVIRIKKEGALCYGMRLKFWGGFEAIFILLNVFCCVYF